MSTCRCGCAARITALEDSVAALQLTLRELQSLLRSAPTQRSAPPAAPSAPSAPTAPTAADGYDGTVRALTAAVGALVPQDARVLVVSRGDDRLLDVPDRAAGHFPQAPGGDYAGHHPRDSDDAVRALDQLRAAGWDHLAFPATATWWLDHYAGLRRHLEATGRLMLRRDGVGLLYGLTPGTSRTRPVPAHLEPA